MKRYSSNKTGCHAKRRLSDMRLLFLIILLTTMPALAQSPRFSGFLQLDKRYNVGGDSLTTSDFYNRLRLEMSAPLGDRLYSFASADLRFYDLPRVNSLSGLEDLNSEYPTQLSLWEAYIEVYGFLLKNMDLRIGKQRFSWGTADKLNPTDNLNPDDFSDLVNFAEKIPIWAVKGTYYLGDFALTGIWLPNLVPVLLPRNAASLFLGDQLANFRDSLALPAAQPQNSMFAFKLSSRIGKWDYSLSYFRGYDDLPVLRGVDINLRNGGDLTGKLRLAFPRIQVVGADFAAEFWGAGFWGEGALFLPEKVISTTRVGSQTFTNVELSDRPYFKFTLGGDYTFPGGLYLNSQWMHGFFTERGGERLHDYFFTRLEKKIFRDKINIALGGALEIAEWQNLGEQLGYGFFPEVAYLAIDNLEIVLGTFVVSGKNSTLFGAWETADQAYLRAKVNF